MQDKFFVERAKELLSRQKINWEDCKRGYDSLAKIKIKSFSIFDSDIKIQYNAGRMTSTSAKVDAASVQYRKCFLCKENRPLLQEEIEIDGYFLLVNPFPIFPDHFTIANKIHRPQSIINNLSDLLKISKLLSGYCKVFYNGPKCGASAPDHLHFQAGTKNFMPIENEFNKRKNSSLFSLNYDYGSVFAIDDGLRKYFLLEFSNASKLADILNNFISSISSGVDEPMMNILSSYDETKKEYQLALFMREKHRPKKYFAEGAEKLLLSPASVDVGGVCILPREEDFNKIAHEHLIEIFQEVFISKEKLLAYRKFYT